jgi:hypothetical protein
VRHNRHGGLLAPLTRDLFRPPTFAPTELRVSEKLRRAGVPTPVMLGYVVYAAPAGFRRADVMTREIERGFDLSVALMSPDPSMRDRALSATVALVSALTEAKAHHRDLNVKNVLLHAGSDGRLEALILDVDRPDLFLAYLCVSISNDAAFVEAAQALGTQLATRPGSTDERLTNLFRRCLVRPPTAEELRLLGEFLGKQRARLANKDLDAARIAGTGAGDVNDRAAWTVVARALLNLDETITKN